MCGIWAFIGNIVSFPKLNYAFSKLQPRGPDISILRKISNNILLGFHRLAIIDTSRSGDQPFKIDYMDENDNNHTIYTICNGEIYNYKKLIETHELLPKSNSDCEVIPLLYAEYGTEYMMTKLDGEYAFLIVDHNTTTDKYSIVIGRDPIGVRPLFISFNNKQLVVSSEMKSMVDICDDIQIFEPGTFVEYNLGDENYKLTKYYNYSYPMIDFPIDNIHDIIRYKFTNAVEKRLISDRPIGCLLSGGLDSSMVSAITAKLLGNQKLRTFTIGLEGGTDLPYAQAVADHIGSNHTVINISTDEALKAIDKTIYTIETFDCTTIRASVWQYLIGKYIVENTDIRVILTGEGMDELASGYRYFHKAPNEIDMHNENIRLIKDIHKYDGLRVDRAMADNGLEVRIPALDPEFLDFYLSINPKHRMVTNGVEKYLFRKAFESTKLLPESVLWRAKEAFSDGTSGKEKSWFQIIQEYIDTLITDEEYETNKSKYTHLPPDTKEKYYYRKKFEEYFGKNYCNTPYYWLPKWSGDVKDPSARVLSYYST